MRSAGYGHDPPSETSTIALIAASAASQSRSGLSCSVWCAMVPPFKRPRIRGLASMSLDAYERVSVMVSLQMGRPPFDGGFSGFGGLQSVHRHVRKPGLSGGLRALHEAGLIWPGERST